MVKIIPLNKIGSDERGATFVFDTERTGQFIIAHRKAGSVNGNHYHTGKHHYKMPEKLVMMSGTITLDWKDMNSEAAGTETVTGPAEIWIPPNVWHKVTAITDFVMLELNGMDAGVGDTMRLNTH
ncbi:MAG: hypothetical protein ABIX01_04505 [Chitinophagaceae bacterium]